MSERLNTICQKIFLFSLLVLWAALSFSSALVEISFTVALVAWVLLKWRSQSIPLWHEKGIAVPLLAYVLLCALSYFWSEMPVLSFRGVFKVLQQVFLFIMTADAYANDKNKNTFHAVFLGAMALLIADTFYQYFRGEDFIRGFKGMEASSGYRVSGSFKSYGILASYLISTLPFLAALCLYDYRRHRASLKWPLALAMTLLATLLLYWTRSRGAFMVLGAGIFLILFFLKRWKILLAVLVLFTGSMFALPRGMMIHLDGYGKEQSLVERYYLWQRALYVIHAKPLTGTGINTYAEAHEKYDQTKNWRVRRYYAHNGYLQIAAETGLPSLLCFLLFLIQYFRSSFRRLRKTSVSPLAVGLLFGCLNFLLFAFVDTVLHNEVPALTFWYLMGTQLALQPPRSPNP